MIIMKIHLIQCANYPNNVIKTMIPHDGISQGCRSVIAECRNAGRHLFN